MLQKVGKNTIPGYFPAYGNKDNTHHIGFTFANFLSGTVVRPVIDEHFYDVMPNNPKNHTNYKIVDVIPSIVAGVGWRLTFKIYVDGKIYEKYVNLS